MDPKFQTSFIPKKPMPNANVSTVIQRQPVHHTTSIFMTLAVLLFIISLSGIAGAIVWKQILLRNQVRYIAELAQREKEFNIEKIEELKQINVQIDTAKQLLSNHIAVSQIFAILSQLTIEKVRFVSLELTNDDKSDVKITMKGAGTNLPAVAFQSDVFNKLQDYGLRKIVKNPILSDPGLDSAGAVGFSFSAEIEPHNLSYTRAINPQPVEAGTTDQSAASSTASSTPQ